MTGSTPPTTDERRADVTNDGLTDDAWADRIALPAVAAAWAAVFVLMAGLTSREIGPWRATLLALAITGTAALTAHAVVAVHDRVRGPWRWPAMAAALVVLASAGHTLLARLGMTQSWGQDLLNLTMICGIALAVRLAWAGYRTRRVLEGEIARRRDVEERLETVKSAAMRPNGPVSVKVGHGQTLLDPTTISLLEADGNFARLHTTDGEVFASESLKALAGRFAPYGFVRVHKSYVVNRASVRGRRGDALELVDGRRAPIGRAFRDALD
jgi:hypothetical protein